MPARYFCQSSSLLVPWLLDLHLDLVLRLSLNSVARSSRAVAGLGAEEVPDHDLDRALGALERVDRTLGEVDRLLVAAGVVPSGVAAVATLVVGTAPAGRGDERQDQQESEGGAAACVASEVLLVVDDECVGGVGGDVR